MRGAEDVRGGGSPADMTAAVFTPLSFSLAIFLPYRRTDGPGPGYILCILPGTVQYGTEYTVL